MNVRKAVLAGVFLPPLIFLSAPTHLSAEIGESLLLGMARYRGVAMAPPIVAKVEPRDLLSPPPATKALVILGDEAEQLIELINEARRTHPDLDGVVLPAFKISSDLNTAASGHSESMATNDFVGHCDPFSTEPMPADRLALVNYDHDDASESIVAGYADAQSVLDALLASPSSRALVLSHHMREIGVGFGVEALDPGNISQDVDEDCYPDPIPISQPLYFYVTVLFGLRSSETLLVIDREAPTTVFPAVHLRIYAEDGWPQDMKLSNEGGAWTDWEEFQSDPIWILPTDAGVKTVYVTIRDAGQTDERQAGDTIEMLPAVFADNFELGNCSLWSDMVVEAKARATEAEGLSQ